MALAIAILKTKPDGTTVRGECPLRMFPRIVIANLLKTTLNSCEFISNEVRDFSTRDQKVATLTVLPTGESDF